VTLPSGEVVTAQVQRRHASPQFCAGEPVAITWRPADSILLPS
jgi:hypothetical protein